MIRYMITQNVLHRPLRTFITVLAVAVEVTLVIIVVGLTSGLLSESAKRIEGVGADIMVQPPQASYLMAFSGAPMPIAIADKLAQLEYVQAVAPVLTQFNTSGIEIVYGIDKASFNAVTGGFVFHEGHDLRGLDDILVDDVYAKSKKIKLGQTLQLFNHDFHVVGIVEHGKGARLFVFLSTLQEMGGAHDKASVFFIKCDRADHTPAVTDEIKELLPRYEVRPLRDLMSLMTSSNLPGLAAFINVMIGIAVVIGFLVIFQSMYTAVMERTREIGILKSMGASKLYIVNVILRETGLLAVAGIVLGIGFSFAASWGIRHRFPLVQVVVSADWVLRAMGVAAVGAIAGALYPAFKAAAKDPIEALAYE